MLKTSKLKQALMLRTIINAWIRIRIIKDQSMQNEKLKCQEQAD